MTGDAAALIAIDTACQMVRTLTGQSFDELDEETITLDGAGTDALLLPQIPVIEILEVFEDDTEVTDYTLHDSGVLLRDAPGVWRFGRNNITVTYSHGYAEVPADVRGVALAMAARYFNQSGGVVFEVLGARQVRYGGNPGDLTAGEADILRRHRLQKQPWRTLTIS